MITDNRNQQKYQLFLNDRDITDMVLSISVSQKEDLLTSMDFTIARGILYLDIIKIGTRVKLYAGTFENGNFRQMFQGGIKLIQPDFNSNGVVNVSYTCYGDGSGKKKGLDRLFYYPGTDSSRIWANKPMLLSSDIVRGIVQDMGMTFGTFNGAPALLISAEQKFTPKFPIKQFLPDWGFLLNFADRLGCKMWEEIDPADGQYKFFFVDSDKAETAYSSKRFVYISRDSAYYNDSQSLELNDIQVMSFSANEDSDMAMGNLRTVSIFDKEGNEKEVGITFDEEKEKYYYYELDEEKIHALSVSEQKALTDLIESSSFSYADIDYYYKKIEYVPMQGSKDWLGVNGRPEIGVSASITFAGDVAVTAHRNYSIRGVSNRYSSKGNSRTWYMKSITHKFGSGGGGYTCSAELYRI